MLSVMFYSSIKWLLKHGDEAGSDSGSSKVSLNTFTLSWTWVFHILIDNIHIVELFI